MNDAPRNDVMIVTVPGTPDLRRLPIAEEQLLLDVIMDCYVTHRTWPNYQYVEVTSFQRHGLEAAPLLESCQRVQIRNVPGRYGWLRTASSMYTQPQEGDEIALSMGGMARTTRGHPDVNRFLAVLRLMCERQRDFVPSPTDVQIVTLTSDQIRDALSSPIADGS